MTDSDGEPHISDTHTESSVANNQSLESLKNIISAIDLALTSQDTSAINGNIARLILWVEMLDIDFDPLPPKVLSNLIAAFENGLDFIDPALKGEAENCLIFCKKLQKATQTEHLDTKAHQSSPALFKQARSANRKVILIEDDNLMLKHMTFQLEHQGFDVIGQRSLTGLEDLIQSENPDIMIMDIMLEEGASAGVEFLQAYKAKNEHTPPTIFISARSDFEARLLAVRGNAIGYLVKPFDFNELVDLIDDAAPPFDPDPFRVLMVDDDALILKAVEQSLTQAGFLVQTTTDPKKSLEIIYDFRPDVMISDINMPDCDGLELAGVVRQLKTFLNMPILFLSAESDKEIGSSAIYKSGDMFISKPVDLGFLSKMVRNRARRSRTMRNLMFEDNLTGLVNRLTFQESLKREIARSTRSKDIFTLAMLDLDHFKRVNDTYGHPTGDRVLKSFSRFLRARLRSTDIIGRYGGEEFAIIMPHTKSSGAEAIMNELRQAFAEVTHECDQDRFKVTFSSGLVSFDPACDAATLIDKADTALYHSKRNGRNRVEIND